MFHTRSLAENQSCVPSGDQRGPPGLTSNDAEAWLVSVRCAMSHVTRRALRSVRAMMPSLCGFHSSGTTVNARVRPSGENCGVLSTSPVVVMRSSVFAAMSTMYASRRSSRIIGVGDASKASRVPSGDHEGAPRTVNAPLVTFTAFLLATSMTQRWFSRKSPS